MTHRGYHVWTDHEVALLFKLRDEHGWEWLQIARKLGIDSPAKCATKYCNIRLRARYETARIYGVPPSSAMVDRERRAEARRQQNLTAQFFGDPPPGYSALDKRRARA